MNEKAKELAALLAGDCKDMEEIQQMLKFEKMLESEMDEHLGYEKNNILGNNSGNSRNGYGKKTLKTELGETEIMVLRDRNGEFEPQVIEKRQTRTDIWRVEHWRCMQKGKRQTTHHL